MKRAYVIPLMLSASIGSSLGQTLTEPVDGSSTYMNYPGFFWTENASAEYYDIEIDDSADFSSPIVSDQIETERYVYSGGLVSGTYHWRVQAVDEYGTPLGWTASDSITINQVSAGNQFTIPDNAPLSQVRSILYQAQVSTPAMVTFAPNGTYRFDLDANNNPWNFSGYHNTITYWFKTGSRSLRATSTEPANKGANQVVTTLLPNTTYTLNGSIRFGDIDGTGNGANFIVTTYDANDVQISYEQTPYLKRDWGAWNDQTLTFTTPADISYAKVVCWVHNLSGQVAFDAVQILDDTGKDHLIDGSFELQDGSAALMLADTSDLIIDGNGSTIILESKSSAIDLDNVSRVSISDLSIDMDPLPYAVCTVDAVYTDVGNESIDVTVWDGYPNIDDVDINAGSMFLMDPVVPGRLKDYVFNGHYGTTKTAMGGRQFKITGLNASLIDEFEVGDRLIASGRVNGIASVEGRDLEEVTFADVKLLASVAGGFGLNNSTKINMIGSGTIIAPGRIFSTNADSMHFYDHRIGPWVEDSLCEGQGDDAVNFKAHGMRVETRVNDTTLRLYSDSGSKGVEVGDLLMIVDADVVGSVVEAHVTSVDIQSSYVEVQVDTPVGTIETGIGFGSTQVYNRDRSTGGFVIRNCVFRDNRARGLSIQTDGVISDSLFEGISGVAIYVVNHLDWGREGFVAPGLKILRNTIKRCGFDYNSTYHGNRGSIDVKVTDANGDKAAYRGQTDILISQNVITDWQHAAIRLSNGDNCIVSYNDIGNEEVASFNVLENYAIHVGNSGNSWVYNNTLWDTRAYTDAVQIDTDCDNISFSAPLNLLPTAQPADFSTVQGDCNWTYEYDAGSGWQPMDYDTLLACWKGGGSIAQIASDFMHPDKGENIALVWNAQEAQSLLIGGTIRKIDTKGNGVHVAIFKNDVQLWPSSGWQLVEGGDTVGYTPSIATDVAAGDKIYFILDSNGNETGDLAEWTPTVDVN